MCKGLIQTLYSVLQCHHGNDLQITNFSFAGQKGCSTIKPVQTLTVPYLIWTVHFEWAVAFTGTVHYFLLLAQIVRVFLNDFNKSSVSICFRELIALKHLNYLDLQLQNFHVNTSNDQLIQDRF